MGVTHAFTSPKADGGDATLVQPSNWNAAHSLSGNLAALDGLANASGYLNNDGAGNFTWGTPTASVAWGSITGTLSSQTDLNSALAGKQATLGGTGFVKSNPRLGL